MAKNTEKTLEFNVKKDRKEEEKYIFQYSNIHANTLSLFILSSSFLIAGMAQFVSIYEFDGMKSWFITLVISTLLFSVSAVLTSLANVFNPLRLKRTLRMLSFYFYMTGALIFFFSLIGFALTILNY